MDSIKYYYYRKLDMLSKEAYKKIAMAIKNFESSVSLHYVKNISKVINAVMSDNPQFFYINWWNIYAYTAFSKNSIEIQFKYILGKNAIRVYIHQAKLIAKMLKVDTAEGTIKNIHDYIVTKVRYDFEGCRKKEGSVASHTVVGPLFENIGVCDGISRTVQLLSRYCGIDCTVISGRARANRERHAWNMLLYQNEYRYFDVTADLPKENEKLKRIEYNFYAKTKEELEVTHIFSS